MKRLLLMMCAVVPVNVLAATAIPQNQHLTVVEYARNSEQSGCGLRATGDTRDGLHVDVLLNVFVEETRGRFGMFKVVVRKTRPPDGAPHPENGRGGAVIGKIGKAWLKTASGMKTVIREGLHSPHNDGYMARLEFDNAAKLLAEIAQTDFRVMYSMEGAGAENTLMFNRRISPVEAGKLTVCMKRLRQASSGRSL